MNTALKMLKESNPQRFEAFVASLKEDLGVEAREAVVSFSCPNCNATLDIVQRKGGTSLGDQTSHHGESSRQPRRGESLNDLLIDLARKSKSTVGKVNSNFKKAIGRKARGLKKDEYRARKIEWLK